jgi:DNA-binding CsgD family transcriptional regulator
MARLLVFHPMSARIAERHSPLHESPQIRALGFVDAWTASGRRTQALADFIPVIEAFGLSAPSAAYSTGFGGSRSCKWLFNTLPRELEDALMGDRIDYENPVVTASSRRHAPYSFLELGADPAGGFDLGAVAAVALGFGLVDGLVVPIHGPYGYLGMVATVSSEVVTLGPGDRAAIGAAAKCIFEVFCKAAELDSVLRPPSLTKREREAIAFVAMGRTDDQIAAALGISPATVRHHIDNVRAKLGAASRAEAVALLAVSGEI